MSEATAASASPGRGLLFDQFSAGQTFSSQGRTVSQADVSLFAGLSGDHNPLHTDEAYASGTVFRGRIAHGLLVQSVASGLAWQIGIFDGTIAALKEMLIRFQSPVMPGDTVRLTLRVAEIDPAPSSRRGWIRFEAQVVNQRGEVVIEGTWTTLMHRKPDRRRELTRGPASG